jgi:hypothetical protein
MVREAYRERKALYVLVIELSSAAPGAGGCVDED